MLLKSFQKDMLDGEDEKETTDKDDNNCNIFGEKKIDKLILMNDVSGLADKSNDFSNFLTVNQKSGYICLYIFHIIYLSKSIWQMILSQTKVFKVFSSSIQLGNILKILTNNCDWETINYNPARDLWINRFYFSLSNKSKNSCLTIDWRKSGPAKCRTNAGSNFEQFCYYGQNKQDRLFNKFLAKRADQNNDSLFFQIDSMTNVTKNGKQKFIKQFKNQNFW